MPTWSDHLWNLKQSKFNTKHSVPLKAIFFLEQSDKDEVVPLTTTVAAQQIFESSKQVWESYWKKISKEDEKKMVHIVFHNSFDLAMNTPCYKLKATLHGEFWNKIEEVF